MRFPAMTRATALPRRPLTERAAAAELRADVRAGRLAADAVDAVLDAAGQRRGQAAARGRRASPRARSKCWLLIARGASNKQVAGLLGITPKTAGTHIERIYSKIGASTRSTATLFAMQQGLLGHASNRSIRRANAGRRRVTQPLACPLHQPAGEKRS